MTTEQQPEKNSWARKLTKATLVATLLLTLVVLLGPRLLRIERIQQAIVRQICTSLQCDLGLQDMEWRWLPLPHLKLKHIRVQKERLRLELPEVTITLRLASLLRRNPIPGDIRLRHPRLHLVLDKSSPAAPLDLSLPGGRVSIEHGTLILEAAEAPAGTRRFLPITLTDLSGQLASVPDRLDFALEGTTPFCRKGIFSGTLNPKDLTYNIAFQLQAINPRQALMLEEGGMVLPDNTLVNLNGGLIGKGLDKFSATITGDMPCLIIRQETGENRLTCGFAETRLEKDGPNLRLEIKKLELTNPGLILSGVIAYEVPGPPEQPRWLIDLEAADLDLSGIRQAVLNVLGRDEIARLVCDIVLGGKAKHASYKFHGPVADFAFLENMRIAVEGIRAPIQVPGADLFLREAQGDILIADGYLSGSGLSAWLQTSHGTNCDLYLDLLERDNAFRLELDIAANLIELPPVLHKLVDWQPFIDELEKFNVFQGQARGHLSLGPDLYDIDTRVKVEEMRADLSYSPIPWPISVFGGGMEIMPTTVSWHDIRARIDEQQINRGAGQVDWSAVDVEFNVQELDAVLDLGPLLDELRRQQILPGQISDAITAVNGPLTTSNLTLQGPISRPAEWRYSLDYKARGVRVKSPLLPEEILVEKSRGQFTDHGARLLTSKAWLLEQPIQLEGELSHTLLADWHGSLAISGVVYDNLAAWIARKDWIPTPLFPAIPCRLDDFRVTWDADTTSLVGNILAGQGEGNAPFVALDINVDPDGVHVRQAAFQAREQRGALTLEFIHSPLRELSFTWQGELAGTTLDALLANNHLLDGRLAGTIQATLPTNPEAAIINGALTADRLYLPLNKGGGQLNISHAALTASGRQVALQPLEFMAGDRPLTLTGELTVSGEGVRMDLNCAAEHLSWSALTDLLGTNYPPTPMAQKPPESPIPPLNWDYRGTCDINLGSLSLTKKEPNGQQDAPDHVFTWSPVTGQLEFFPARGIGIRITEATLCKIRMSGTWFSVPEFGKNTLIMETSEQTPPLFEEVLPCLGMKKDLIQGPFSLNALLQHENGHWLIGRGEIESGGGYIKRLSLLSQVFSVINVTDLFKQYDLRDVAGNGFAYSALQIKTLVKDDRLSIERALIKGDGLNLFAEGDLNLRNNESDLTLLIAPFKTIDTIITSVPIIGKAVGGENKAIITIPVGISGKIQDPDIKILPAKAIGKSILNLVTSTISLPFAILGAEFEPK